MTVLFVCFIIYYSVQCRRYTHVLTVFYREWLMILVVFVVSLRYTGTSQTRDQPKSDGNGVIQITLFKSICASYNPIHNWTCFKAC